MFHDFLLDDTWMFLIAGRRRWRRGWWWPRRVWLCRLVLDLLRRRVWVRLWNGGHRRWWGWSSLLKTGRDHSHALRLVCTSHLLGLNSCLIALDWLSKADFLWWELVWLLWLHIRLVITHTLHNFILDLFFVEEKTINRFLFHHCPSFERDSKFLYLWL